MTSETTKGRRGHGEGTLRERKPGQWEMRVTLPSGKRISVYGASKTATRRKAQDTVRELAAAAESGVPIPDRKSTLETYLKDWLLAIEPNVRPATLAAYRSHVNNHLIPSLGQIKLIALTPAHIERMMASKREEGLSARTIGHLRAVLRDALSRAERHGLVTRNVARLVDSPYVSRPELTILEQKDAAILIAAALGYPNGAVYVVGITLGLRLGECLGLRWRDVNFDEGTLSVRQAYQRVAGTGAFVEPKSKTSRRTLPIPAITASALRHQRREQAAMRLRAGSWSDNDLVFAGKDGKPLNPSSTTRRLHEITQAAGIPDVRFHDLRHSAASALVASGTPVNIVAEVLGHTSVSLTLGTYAHVMAEGKRQAADTIDKLYGALAVPQNVPLNGR